MQKVLYCCRKIWIITLVLMLPGIISSWPLPAQDITTGLILHYTFDSISGTIVNDGSGNGNNGTLRGGAEVVEGFSGNGVLCLDKPDYIDAPDNINAGLSSFTFASWVKLSALKNATRFFDWGNGTDGSNNFLVFIPSYNGDNAYMVLRFRPVSGTAYNVTSTAKCPVGEWAHVAVSFTWNGVSGTAVLYLNGKPVGSGSNLPYNPDTFLGTTADNYFGYSRWAQDGNGFGGIFDDIRVYNRALTIEDIDSLADLADLFEQFEQLDLGDLSSVTGDISLPTVLGEQGVTVSWVSSNNAVIDTTGKVNRPDYFDYTVTLTARVAYGSFVKEKVFTACVVAVEGTTFSGDLLVRFDFSNLTGSTVKDVSEKQFQGTVMEPARVVTVGTPETGIYNVLDLGETTGYFDMGPEVGKVVRGLNDFSMGAYFRVRESYIGVRNAGNLLWNFSNSDDMLTDRNGYIIGSLSNQGVSITPGYHTESSGSQSVSLSRPSLRGNWHHLAYTQNGNTGTVYIDGVAITSGTVTNRPSVSLVEEGVMGTLFNWLGRSCYRSDAYLRYTLVYDFRIYGRALSGAEIRETGMDVIETLASLEAASSAYIGESKTAETALIEKTLYPEPSYLEIINTDRSSVRISFQSFDAMTFTDTQTIVSLKAGGTRDFATSDILKMVFGVSGVPVNPPVSASEPELFPNPASDYIILRNPDSETGTVTIHSVTGHLLMKLPVHSSPAEIDITSLPEGIYIMKKGNRKMKFVKQ
ncbi:MAG: T9SS type A sorting domain-containing protein [Bacteroidales bacterium]|nr:T9SS type A sorting domain-containing protein [Bacteroidales bacterium]MBN2697650.1 T9SS type A sorting domain-containing protein [Bacteroidales bacterium]